MQTQPGHPLYPLLFQPIYKEKVWGGRALEKLGRNLPDGPDTLIGESWELADLGQTSASGGGGGAERSVVANGPLAGQTLHQLMDVHGRDLLGDLETSPFGEFPLLVKFLDARQNLSVQVHPTPEYARQHPDAFLKSEAWYIVDAAPDAVIYKGIREGVTPDQFRQAIHDNNLEPLLIKVPVKPGDCHYLPSGTCHALGAGVLVAEVQTPSDTTFRVYDWGRTGRELHLEQAMKSMHFGPPDVSANEKPALLSGTGTTLMRLVVCEHFRIDRVDAPRGHHQELSFVQPAIWMILRGRGRITSPDAPDLELHPGQTLLLPPGISSAQLQITEPTRWLEVTFPRAYAHRLAEAEAQASTDLR